MSWLKFTFASNRDQLNHFSDKLELAGAQAVTIEDAGDNPLFDLLDGELPVWDSSQVTGLFNADEGVDAVCADLAKAFAPEPLPQYRVETLAEQDWERCWMDRFQPMQYGKGLWVYPTWCEPPSSSLSTNIILDPGLAFGSGSHETTHLCLEWLSRQDLTDKNVMDYGCGSGILAIAALKLGGSSALGIDIDPQALKASRQNAQLNDVSENLQLDFPADIPARIESDIIFANILAGTLIELKARLLAFRKPGGVLVLSGILKSQQAIIYKAFEPANTIEVFSRGDWIMMTVTASL